MPPTRMHPSGSHRFFTRPEIFRRSWELGRTLVLIGLLVQAVGSQLQARPVEYLAKGPDGKVIARPKPLPLKDPAEEMEAFLRNDGSGQLQRVSAAIAKITWKLGEPGWELARNRRLRCHVQAICQIAPIADMDAWRRLREKNGEIVDAVRTHPDAQAATKAMAEYAVMEQDTRRSAYLACVYADLCRNAAADVEAWFSSDDLAVVGSDIAKAAGADEPLLTLLNLGPHRGVSWRSFVTALHASGAPVVCHREFETAGLVALPAAPVGMTWTRLGELVVLLSERPDDGLIRLNEIIASHGMAAAWAGEMLWISPRESALDAKLRATMFVPDASRSYEFPEVMQFCTQATGMQFGGVWALFMPEMRIRIPLEHGPWLLTEVLARAGRQMPHAAGWEIRSWRNVVPGIDQWSIDVGLMD